MKKSYIILLIILFFIFITILRLWSPEDTWLCQNGVWVKHGHPTEPQPTAVCSGIK